MNARIVKLKFTAPFHLNPAGDTQEKTETAVSSDMLISALAACHTKLYGNFCTDFFSGKMLVSSLFPFYKDTLFFPAPLFQFKHGKTLPSQYKKISKLKYLDFSLWSKVIQGETLDTGDVHSLGIFGISPSKQTEIPPFFLVEDVQRLGKDPFYFSQVRLHPDAGMFFLFQVDAEIEPRFKACLRLLGDEGIGGDRTVGKGLFEIIRETDIHIPDVDTPHIMNLSFFIPSPDDVQNMDLNRSFYRLQHKRGWYITHKFLNLKKKGIFGFSEGSVFFTRGALTGKIAVLLKKEEIKSPTLSPFDVLRSGLLFGIPVKCPGVSHD